ncbi:hypothetical protein EUZ85_17370 [Hahella sp. KA22]|nr:hypothetical protein ENC22_14795 [Hahella sp. KA22]QAY55771.1 hypothetical protein EUZ85_17370 [Hahella sp. KA22]
MIAMEDNKVAASIITNSTNGVLSITVTFSNTGETSYCSGLIVPDTLIRDNTRQRLRCQHESEKVV